MTILSAWTNVLANTPEPTSCHCLSLTVISLALMIGPGCFITILLPTVSFSIGSQLASGMPACLMISLARCMRESSTMASVHWYTFALSSGSCSARRLVPARPCATGPSPSLLRPLLPRVAEDGPCMPGAPEPEDDAAVEAA